MPKEQFSQLTARQRPVSCGFCRKRKLRCSRDAPCSNCISRGVQCDLEEAAKSSTPTAGENSQSEILDRLRNLEQLLETYQSGQASGQANGAVEKPAPTNTLLASHTSDLKSQVQSLDQDVALLESIYLEAPAPKHGELPSNRILYKTCPIKDLGQVKVWHCHHDLPLSHQSYPVRCVWLPTYAEAQLLLRKYVRVAAHFPWVTHPPSLAGMLDDIYSTLQRQGQIKPGPLMLLLAIFACATHSWTTHDCEQDGIYENSASAIAQSRFWVDAAQDVIAISRNHTSLSIEGMSGSVILAFLLMQMEGMSRRCRAQFDTAYWISRDLGLHRIDHPNSKYDPNAVETELARRIFWYICASDWQVGARFNGIDEGIYTYHPRQIITRRPRHSDDNNILLEQPLSVPTTMSYPLHRIKIAEICRNIVDRSPLASSHLGGSTPEELMDIDTDLQVLLNEAQPFFSLPQDELIAKYRLNPDMAADIVQQGHTLRFLLHTQRCRIHLPYFTKGYTSRLWAPIKDLCIKSARLTIRSQSHLLDAGLLNGTMFPYIGLLLGVFTASIVLLVDLCMMNSSDRGEVHREEICQAFRLLESARHESETISRFVDSLTHVLRKHKISPPKSTMQPTRFGQNLMNQPSIVPPATNDTGSALMTPDSNSFTGLSNDMLMTENTGEMKDDDLSTYFNDLAQSFEQGDGIVNAYDWDNIFSDLNGSLV